MLRQGVSHIVSQVGTDELFREIPDRRKVVQNTQGQLFLYSTGHQNNRERWLVSSNSLDDLQLIHAWHRKVGDDQVERERSPGLNRLYPNPRLPRPGDRLPPAAVVTVTEVVMVLSEVV